jgi:Co/Zn/Cd efflux system component
MSASWIFSKNDVIANLGIIVVGGLVYILDSRFPDLIIGLVISIIVIRGSIHILTDAGKEKQLVEKTEQT